MVNRLLDFLPTLDRIKTKITLQDAYEITTGVFNHLDKSKKRPLSSVAMFPSEDYSSVSPYYDHLTEFAMNDYGSLWNISLSEYMAMPSWLVRLMREISGEVRSKKSKAVDELKKGLGG